MINYRVDIYQEDPRDGFFYIADVYAGSDLLKSLKNLYDFDEAKKVSSAFIDGIKFARGENDDM